jgi:6,7-dimethyl-8-ribityllumazine synthase
LHAKLLAESERYAAIVAAGFVVDGGIYRHDFVAASVIDALMAVQLDTRIPIISVVLTPQRFHEHEQHRDFFLEHFLIKGAEAAEACAATLRSLEKLIATASLLKSA